MVQTQHGIYIYLQATNTSRIQRAIAAECAEYYRTRKSEVSCGTMFFALLFRPACEGAKGATISSPAKLHGDARMPLLA